MLKSNDDVYKEALQLLMRMASFDANIVVPSPTMANSPPHKRAKIALDSKSIFKVHVFFVAFVKLCIVVDVFFCDLHLQRYLSGGVAHNSLLFV